MNQLPETPAARASGCDMLAGDSFGKMRRNNIRLTDELGAAIN